MNRYSASCSQYQSLESAVRERKRASSAASSASVERRLGRKRGRSARLAADVRARLFFRFFKVFAPWPRYTRRPVYSSSILSSKKAVGFGAAMKRR